MKYEIKSKKEKEKIEEELKGSVRFEETAPHTYVYKTVSKE